MGSDIDGALLCQLHIHSINKANSIAYVIGKKKKKTRKCKASRVYKRLKRLTGACPWSNRVPFRNLSLHGRCDEESLRVHERE